MTRKRLFLSFVLLLAGVAFLQAQYATLHHFSGPPADGDQPYGSLIRKGSALYGMTCTGGVSDAGTIFKIGVDGTGFTLLHSFAGGASDGSNPYGSLAFFSGKLYGFTSAGGTNDCGVVFRVNPDGTGFALIHSFSGGAADGEFPYGSLIFSGNKLYGMTSSGGANDLGAVFQISPTGDGFKLLYSFAGGAADGSYPWYGRLIARGSVLYGTTSRGGIHTRGVIFRINKNGTGYAVLHLFAYNTTNGAYSYESLIFGGAKLYGLTQRGGATFDGTIFRINPDGTGFEILHSFNRSAGEGAYPYGGLIKNGKIFYGMTWLGGSADLGAVFSYKIN